MLQNRIYRGEITHKGNSYPGEHPAIIDQPLWDEVQAVLAKNRVERATGARAKHPSLLGGFVFDATGERLTPTYAIKKGTRYRYYISTSLYEGGKRQPLRRLAYTGRRFGRLGDQQASHVSRRSHSAPRRHRRRTAERFRAKPTDRAWPSDCGRTRSPEHPDKVKATLMALLCRVEVNSDRIEINLSRRRLAELLAGQSIDLATQHQRSDPYVR